jgi:hypothetical protein
MRGSNINLDLYWDLCGFPQSLHVSRGADKSLAFERSLVSSRQCCFSQGGHYAPEIGNLHFEVLKQPAYSPDLAPSDYYLFPNLFIKPKTYQPLS